MRTTARNTPLALEAPPEHLPSPSDPMPEHDPTLAAATRGDERALHALALRLLPRVRNAVRYLVRGDDIDDLVQDVLVTVLERLASFEGRSSFEAWVDGVSLRVILGRMRKLRANERRFAPLEQEPARIEPIVRGQAYATSRQLVRALDRLSDAKRTALVLHHVFGLTVPEIASELQAPQETVRTRLRDGMGELRALLRVKREE
jgi:RNA polymerase sigma-70 factor (ECF subfamily)